MQNYNSILISVLVLAAYFGSVMLVKLKKVELRKQRRFWNIVLLISFLTSGILGLILAILIDQKISISWYLSMLRLHVRLGIVMAIVSIFHAWWHLKYYFSLGKD